MGLRGGVGTDPFLGEKERHQQTKQNEADDVGRVQHARMQQAHAVIRYPLLLGGNERLEAGGDPEAQLVEERRL